MDNESISLYAWDYSSDVLAVPDSIIGKNMVSVSNRAFKNDANLTAVDFTSAQHLRTIGIETFYNSGLSSKVVIPSSVEAIGERAFENCLSLPEVEFKDGISSIPTQCFNRCSSLNAVILPESLRTIAGFAFANCPLLEYVEIPIGVESIHGTAFRNDTNLTLGVWYDSYGYQYAVQNNINYMLLDGVKLGDADGNQSVNVNDATKIQSYLAELASLEGIYLHAADANEDGEIDISDATAIQMYAAEYQTGHPIGQVMTK